MKKQFKWTKRRDGQTFEDGARLLVAIPCGSFLVHELVTISCDGDSFRLKKGNYQCAWDWDAVSHFVDVKNIPTIPVPTRRQVTKENLNSKFRRQTIGALPKNNF